MKQKWQIKSLNKNKLVSNKFERKSEITDQNMS